MPWRCPACQTHIEHNAFEESPRPGTVYRCHVCRLELIADPKTDRLTVVPFSTPADETPTAQSKDRATS